MPRIKSSEKELTQSITRQKLLDAAALEFARMGYAAANINAISLAAGYAKGTIYNYFPAKRALMEALIESTALQHADMIRAAVLAVEDPRQRLERFFTAGFEFVTQRLAPARVMISMLHGPDEDFKALMFQAYQPLFDLVAREILLPGLRLHILRRIDPPSTALLVMTIYLGTAGQVTPQGKPWLDPAVVADFVYQSLVRKT